MTPDEVLAKLETMGIKTSRSTLLRFEQDGLIPKPKRGSGGRAQGRFSEYPKETPYFFFAAWMLLKSKKYTKEDILKGIMLAKTMVNSILSHSEKRGYEDEERLLVEDMEFILRFFETDNSQPEITMSRDAIMEYFMELRVEHGNKIGIIAHEWQEYVLFPKSKAIDLAKYSSHSNDEIIRLYGQVEELENENKALRAILKKHGINPA